MSMAVALASIAIGSVLFHVLSPWWLTPIASDWRDIDTTMIVTFWITGVAFTGIVLFMAYCVWRFRHRPGARADYEPENHLLENWLAVGTAVGVAVILAPGLLVWRRFVNPPPDAATIEVVGQQWQWSFRLPGADGRLGAADSRYVTPDNPLGISPGDPFGKDDLLVTFGDLHLPIDKPVRVLLRSIDVVHNFYVPEFRAKMDLMPGMVTSFWFTPTRTGSYEILCAGFCGVGHPQMRGIVVVEPESAYEHWRQSQKTTAQLQKQRTAATGP
jgi:cytochrome c oxidase subunit 2